MLRGARANDTLRAKLAAAPMLTVRVTFIFAEQLGDSVEESAPLLVQAENVPRLPVSLPSPSDAGSAHDIRCGGQ